MSALAEPQRAYHWSDRTEDDLLDYPEEWWQLAYHRRHGSLHRSRHPWRRDNTIDVHAFDRMLKVAYPPAMIHAAVAGESPFLAMINRCVERDVEAQKLYEEAKMLNAANPGWQIVPK